MTVTRSRRSLSLLAVAAATALLTAACGGGSDDGGDDNPVIGQPDGRAAASARPGASLVATPGATGGAKASTAPGAQGSKPGQSSGGSTQNGGAPAGGTGGKAKPGTTVASVKPGTYTYDASGTFTAGGTPRPVKSTSQLKVDAPQGATQHSVLGGDQGSNDQTVRRNGTGTYLVRLKLENPAFSKEFAPKNDILLVPRPASVGRSWSWTMTSTDGKTTAAFTGTVTKNETLTIGGKKTPTAVIESTLKLSGDVDYTAKTTTNYSEADLLQVRDRTRGSGSFSGFPFSTDITSVLRSTSPS